MGNSASAPVATKALDVVLKVKGKQLALREIAGPGAKAILIVNVASQCGFTPQYKGLQALHDELGPRGLVIVGTPCNQFGACVHATPRGPPAAPLPAAAQGAPGAPGAPRAAAGGRRARRVRRAARDPSGRGFSLICTFQPNFRICKPLARPLFPPAPTGRSPAPRRRSRSSRATPLRSPSR